MDKEVAAPDRVKKREAEEVSSLLSWLRGEAVCHLGVCARARWGSGNAPQRHPLVKTGRVWCLETSLEQRQMNERKCQTILPIPTPLARGSWELSARFISWTCPQLTRGDLPKIKSPSWEPPKYRLVRANSIQAKPLSRAGTTVRGHPGFRTAHGIDWGLRLHCSPTA